MGRKVETKWEKIGKFRGIVNPQLNSVILRKSLADINNLAKSPDAELLQAGRHRTIRLTLESANGPIIAVAKFFGKQNLCKDFYDRLKGSKAKRTYKTAAYLANAGVGTTYPIACLERWIGPVLRESCFISLYMEDVACFKDMLVDLWQQNAPYSEFDNLMRIAAYGIKKLHDSGCTHGDLGNQNVFFTKRAKDLPYEDAVFMDLNRARFGKPLTMAQRAKDLARVALPEGFFDRFFELYWGGKPPKSLLKMWKAYRRAFRFHSETRKFRHPIRELSYRLDPRKAPAQAAYPPRHKQWIWDDGQKCPANVLLPKSEIRLLDSQYRIITRRESRLITRRLIASNICAKQVEEENAETVSRRLIIDATDAEADLVKLNFAGINKALIRFSMADSRELTETKLNTALTLIQNNISIAVAITQMPPWVKAGFSDFVNKIVSRLDGNTDWISVGQGINTIKWGIRSFEDLNDIIKAEQSLFLNHPARSLSIATSAIESPVCQFGVSNITKLFERNAPYSAITLVWDKSNAELATELQLLHALAAGTFYANRKIIVIANSEYNGNEQVKTFNGFVSEICALSFQK